MPLCAPHSACERSKHDMKVITKGAVALFFHISALLATAAPALRTVYVMPMAHGMDQYFANSLANTRTLQVTTDPAKAELVLTDRVDAVLDEFLEDHRPELRRLAETTPAVDPGHSEHAMMPDMVVLLGRTSSPSRRSSLSRPKGTLFLVNATSRQIVWSTFEVPKDDNPKELDRAARRVVERLKKEFSSRQ
jgi:hypothetical protein